MISQVSQPVGTNVKIYLDNCKGKKVKFGKGKLRKRNVSFKGKIHEIRRDCVVIKGMFVHTSALLGSKVKFPQYCGRKFLLKDIMRIVKIESVTI